MQRFWKGSLEICKDQINLDLTLLGGQSFRWEKIKCSDNEVMWRGVAFDAFWELTQTTSAVYYKVHPLLVAADSRNFSTEYFHNLLRKYFRLDFDIRAAMQRWRDSHPNFLKTEQTANAAVRVLDQEPLENILSFICSQNNHIRRISSMIEWLCLKYGRKIGTFSGKDQFTFPTLELLLKEHAKLELQLREAKFGYRAKFISKAIENISDFGGSKWFTELRSLPYREARFELMKLPGIGYKVADCICLMSLNHLESVPIDTHIFKIVKTAYMPHLEKYKSVTPKIYEEIGTHLRSIYGEYAGWAQAVLFCSDLQRFQADTVVESLASQSKSKRKK